MELPQAPAMRLGDVEPEINDVSGSIVDAAFRVHSILGPGLLENAYRDCLAIELRKRGHGVEKEVVASIVYGGERLASAYRLDLCVDRTVIVETKAVEELHPVHWAQLRTYLKLAGAPVGLLVNFHTPRLKDGIFRVVHSTPS